MNYIVYFFRNIIEFIFPPFCITCEERLEPDDVWACRSCWNSLRRVKGAVRDGVIELDFIDEIRAGAYYDQKLQTLIHHFKYSRALGLAEGFSDILTVTIAGLPDWLTADLLVPVPLHKVKYRERAYNQSEEIAKALSRKISISCRTDVLLRGVNTVSQTQMADAKERVKNMTDVFAIKESEAVTGKKVILIDDLITTGSTANACARVLKEHGAKTVYVLTVGRPYFD
jgi:ComF family protein